MDRSVFLSDIDGTLVRGDVLPAPEVVQAADVFRAAGGLLSLCTGRSVEGARPVAESLSVDTPCVLYGGAALYDFSADRFLWSVPFSPHILDCMERFLREFPHLSLQVLTEQGSFVLRRNALLNAKGVRVENQGPEVPLSALPIPILKLVLCGETGRSWRTAGGVSRQSCAASPSPAVTLWTWCPGRPARPAPWQSWPNGWKSPSPSVCAPAME